MSESKLVEQFFREANWSWNIDPLDRSWFVTVTGELWSDVSHRLMLKKKFPEKWEQLKQRKMEDGDIEETFTKSLLNEGYTKIGELDNYYAEILKLDERAKDALKGFAESLLLVKSEDSNKIITIHQKISNEIIKSTLKEVANDFLFTIK
jgi:hypothetical protein